jgi:hypothetical protein
MAVITTNYPLNVLYKHKQMLEANLANNPQIEISIKMLPLYRKQLREVMQAISSLEKVQRTFLSKFDAD